MKLLIVTTIMTILTLSSTVMAGEPEKLLGIKTDFNKEILIISVASNGCTKKGDFSIINKKGALKFIRKNQDHCKAMPRKIDIKFLLKEIGVDKNQPFKIINEFIVNTNLAMY